MNEDAGFFRAVELGAANLGVQVRVGKDGRMGLHVLAGAKPDPDKLATFREFLARNRARILRANGMDPNDNDAVRADAQRLLDWLMTHQEAPECWIGIATGEQFNFHERRAHLVRTYEPAGAWILRAYKFRKAVLEQVRWELAAS